MRKLMSRFWFSPLVTILCRSKWQAQRLLLVHLPAELLGEICSHLEKSSDLKAASLVCRTLRTESQKRLFSRLRLQLGPTSDRGDREAQVKATQRLQDKIEAVLSLPFGISSLTISVRSNMPKDPWFLAVEAPKRFALIRQYLTETNININSLKLDLKDSKSGWSTPAIALLVASRHTPTRLELTLCPRVQHPINLLSGLLARWPSCDALAIHLHWPRINPSAHLWGTLPPVIPMNADYARFFAQGQLQLRKAYFFTAGYFFEKLASASFLATLQSLQFEVQCCRGLEKPFRDAKAAGVAIMIEEIDILWGKAEIAEPAGYLCDFRAILGACSRLKRAHIEGLFMCMRFSQLPLTLEYIRVIDKSPHLEQHATALKRMIDWLCDPSSSPQLKEVELYISWDQHEARLREDAEDEDPDDYAWGCDLDELAVRYPWAANSPLEDLRDVEATLVEGQVRDRLTTLRSLVACARTAMRDRGVRFCLDMPSFNTLSCRLVQPYL